MDASPAVRGTCLLIMLGFPLVLGVVQSLAWRGAALRGRTTAAGGVHLGARAPFPPPLHFRSQLPFLCALWCHQLMPTRVGGWPDPRPACVWTSSCVLSRGRARDWGARAGYDLRGPKLRRVKQMLLEAEGESDASKTP